MQRNQIHKVGDFLSHHNHRQTGDANIANKTDRREVNVVPASQVGFGDPSSQVSLRPHPITDAMDKAFYRLRLISTPCSA
jgi:hypothetical protein